MTLKKSCFIFFLAIAFFKMRSQEKLDNAKVRVIYEFSFKSDANQETFHRPDIMYLDVGEKVSKFYSYYNAVRDSVRDDGLKRNLSAFEINEITKQYKRGTTSIYYRENTKKKMVVTDNWGFYFTFYDEPIQLPEWKITDDFKDIDNLKSQKATANYMGRKWTVYFTRDIPLNLGPWKLWGLPGLIVEAGDKDGLFYYRLKNYTNLQNEIPIVLVNTTSSGGRYVRNDKNIFRNIEKIYYTDTRLFMENYLGMKGGVATNPDGSVIIRKLSIPYIPLEPW